MRTSIITSILTAVCIFVASATSGFAQTPAETEKNILDLLKRITETGSYSGGFDEDKIYAANEELTALLVRNGKSDAMLKYAFPKLKGKMFVATSKDGNFRIYSWDKETGGTMHDFASVIQYRGKSGKVYVTAENQGEDDAGGAFYHEIFQLAGKTGQIYLATSTFIGSSSLNGQSIKTIRINGDTLDFGAKLIKTSEGMQNSVGFSYDFFSVVDRPERPVKLFTFNEKARTFRFPIVIEDDRTPQGRVTNRYITYRFNGTHFVKR